MTSAVQKPVSALIEHRVQRAELEALASRAFGDGVVGRHAKRNIEIGKQYPNDHVLRSAPLVMGNGWIKLIGHIESPFARNLAGARLQSTHPDPNKEAA